MRATSEHQYAAAAAREVPTFEEFREGCFSLPLPIPEGFPPYNFCYLILDDVGGVHVFDPGSASEQNWGLLKGALRKLGLSFSDIANVFVTHLHPDHLGLAHRVAHAAGVKVSMLAGEWDFLEQVSDPAELSRQSENEVSSWGVPPGQDANLAQISKQTHAVVRLPRGLSLFSGQVLDIPGRDFEAIHTPGHTGGHVVFVGERERILLSGDHVLPNIMPGIGLGGVFSSNPLATYLDSLRLTAEYDEYEVCPGHGYRFTGLAERSDAIISHVQRRLHEVEAVLQSVPGASVWQVAERLTWGRGWENLRGFLLFSALKQSALYVDFVQSQ